jgi:hypothetical protein
MGKAENGFLESRYLGISQKHLTHFLLSLNKANSTTPIYQFRFLNGFLGLGLLNFNENRFLKNKIDSFCRTK